VACLATAAIAGAGATEAARAVGSCTAVDLGAVAEDVPKEVMARAAAAVVGAEMEVEERPKEAMVWAAGGQSKAVLDWVAVGSCTAATATVAAGGHMEVAALEITDSRMNKALGCCVASASHSN
jgi:hypothetical protein